MMRLIVLAAALQMSLSTAFGDNVLTLAFYDFAGLSSAEADQAIQSSRRFFAILGLQTDWVICQSRDCSSIEARPIVRIRVVDWTKGTVLGFANAEASAAGYPQVYVFLPRVRRLASRTNYPAGLVLACVMTHEILHSLGVAHAAHGIMREAFDAEDLARFGRSPSMPRDQLEQLRIGLARLVRQYSAESTSQ